MSLLLTLRGWSSMNTWTKLDSTGMYYFVCQRNVSHFVHVYNYERTFQCASFILCQFFSIFAMTYPEFFCDFLFVLQFKAGCVE